MDFASDWPGSVNVGPRTSLSNRPTRAGICYPPRSIPTSGSRVLRAPDPDPYIRTQPAHAKEAQSLVLRNHILEPLEMTFHPTDNQSGTGKSPRKSRSVLSTTDDRSDLENELSQLAELTINLHVPIEESALQSQWVMPATTILEIEPRVRDIGRPSLHPTANF